MNAVSSASEAPGMDGALHHNALGMPRTIERRRGIEYLESRGFDYPFALFWGSYAAAALGVLIGWLWG